MDTNSESTRRQAEDFPGVDGRLKKHFGLEAGDDEGLRRALGVDFFEIIPQYTGPPLHPDIPGRKIDIWGIRTRWVEHESGGYWEQACITNPKAEWPDMRR